MMELFKYTTLVFALVLVTAFQEPATSSPTESTKGRELWNKIREHIRADDMLIKEARANTTRMLSSSITGLPLPEDRKRWMALLQKVLERRVENTSPSTVATTAKTSPTTLTTPVVKSREIQALDFQKLLSFLSKSRINLNNDQWRALLKLVLSSKLVKETTVSPKPTHVVPTTSAGSHASNRNEMNNAEWTQRLQKLLDNESAHKNENDNLHRNDQVTRTGVVQTATASPQLSRNEIWQIMQMYLNDKMKENSLNPSPSTPTPTTKTTTTTTATWSVNDLSEQQWEFLLKHYLNRNWEQKKDNSFDSQTTSSTPTARTKPRTTKGVSTDDPWPSLLDQYLNGNLKQEESSTPSTVTKVPITTTTTSTKRIPISNEQWQRLLQQYLNGDIKRENNTLNTLALSSSPLKMTTTTTITPVKDMSDEQWQFQLQQYLDENSQREESPKQYKSKAGDISAEQLETLFKLYLTRNQKDENFVTTTHSSTSSTSTATTTRPVINTSETSEKQWEILLQQILDENPSQRDRGLKTRTATPAAHTSSTASPEPSVNNAVGRGNMSDEEWFHLLDQTFHKEKPQVEHGGKFQQSTPKPQRVSQSPQNKALATTPPPSAKDLNKLNDKEWTKLLDDVLEPPQNKALTTNPPPNAKDLNKLNDKEWTKLLDDVLEPREEPRPQTIAEHPSTNEPDKKFETIPGEVKTTASTDTPLPTKNGGRTNGTPTGSPSPSMEHTEELENEQWENVLQLILDGGELDGNTQSPPTWRKSDNTIVPGGEKRNSSKEPRFDKMIGIEKMENEGTENMIYLILVGVSAVLVIFVICTTLFMCRKKKLLCWSKKEMHSTILNADLNRFDLQVLRPSKENMNAFLYSSPAFDDVTVRY